MVLQETVIGKLVTFLHHLHLVLTLGYAQGEGTLRVGRDEMLAGIVNQLSVELERCTRHRHRGVAVVHIA